MSNKSGAEVDAVSDLDSSSCTALEAYTTSLIEEFVRRRLVQKVLRLRLTPHCLCASLL